MDMEVGGHVRAGVGHGGRTGTRLEPERDMVVRQGVRPEQDRVLTCVPGGMLYMIWMVPWSGWPGRDWDRL